MTQTETRQQRHHSPSENKSPYATEDDWWYNNDEDDDVLNGHDELPGTSRAEYVAHQLLKKGATLLDPITLNAPPDRGVAPLFEYLFDESSGGPSDPAALHTENEAVEVTDPSVHVPKRHEDSCFGVDYNQFDKRWRVSEEYGYLCRGPVIANRPTSEFMAVVDQTLDTAEEAGYRGFAPREKRKIRQRALNAKTDGGPHDQTIMEEVVRCIDTPGRVFSDSESAPDEL